MLVTSTVELAVPLPIDRLVLLSCEYNIPNTSHTILLIVLTVLFIVSFTSFHEMKHKFINLCHLYLFTVVTNAQLNQRLFGWTMKIHFYALWIENLPKTCFNGYQIELSIFYFKQTQFTILGLWEWLQWLIFLQKMC